MTEEKTVKVLKVIYTWTKKNPIASAFIIGWVIGMVMGLMI